LKLLARRSRNIYVEVVLVSHPFILFLFDLRVLGNLYHFLIHNLLIFDAVPLGWLHTRMLPRVAGTDGVEQG
jgi:hypothetical protein